MTGELIRTDAGGQASGLPLRLPPVPWRDPHTVSPAKLSEYIRTLEIACEENPRSADLRTCLGMAYAMNYEVNKSEDALELATQLEPDHFFAQLKYAELHYRLRALIRAERETLKASELATNSWELSIARKQLLEIRRLMRDGTQKPEWSKPLTRPALLLLVMTIFLCLAVHWK
jgi:cytochrome c-type biogenesis protein CcmH/NrfG